VLGRDRHRAKDALANVIWAHIVVVVVLLAVSKSQQVQTVMDGTIKIIIFGNIQAKNGYGTSP